MENGGSKRVTQAESNPFPFSDSNKRYYTYDYYLRTAFGGKCVKLPIDAGFTCPNIDGRCGYGGCIYCSGRGSGDFASPEILPVAAQIAEQKKILSRKWDVSRWIAYFQAHTNTYASVDVLREKVEEALGEEGIVGVNLATRADCLPDDVLVYLGELAERTVLTVELGLQSSSDETAVRINRGHTFAQFCQGVDALRRTSPKIRVGVHLIFGLPGEDDETMAHTVRDVAALRPDEVKLHLLHVLRGTRLAQLYTDGEYLPLERERYIRLVADALELLPPDTVVGRLTGDGKGTDLLAPRWSVCKKAVVNDVDKLLFARGTVQGCRYRA